MFVLCFKRLESFALWSVVLSSEKCIRLHCFHEHHSEISLRGFPQLSLLNIRQELLLLFIKNKNGKLAAVTNLGNRNSYEEH